MARQGCSRVIMEEPISPKESQMPNCLIQQKNKVFLTSLHHKQILKTIEIQTKFYIGTRPSLETNPPILLEIKHPRIENYR